MNVNELMSREPRVVRMGDRCDAAARVMWEQDCGIVPVVDGSNVVVGVLTDRDLCMASYTQGRPLSDLPVTSSMARAVRTCRPEDSVATAIATMQQLQVHRLPVVDARGVLVGIVSTNDLLRTAHVRPAAVDSGSVVKLLATIGAPRRTAALAATASAAVRPAVHNTTAMVGKPGVAAAAAAAPAVSPKPAVASKPVAADPISPAAGKGKAHAKGKPKGRKA